jgi:hypothetical protein
MTLLLAAQREPPNAAVAAVILLLALALGLARSWWRSRKDPLFAPRKMPPDDKHAPEDRAPN